MIKRFIEWARKESFWDLMAWASLAMIFFWALAKSFGWINTPILIEMIPLFGAVFWAGRMFQQLEDSRKELSDHKNETRKGFQDIKHQIGGVKNDIQKVDRRLTRVEASINPAL